MKFFSSLLNLQNNRIEELIECFFYPSKTNKIFISGTHEKNIWYIAQKYQLSGFFHANFKFNVNSALKKNLGKLHKEFTLKYMLMKSDLRTISSSFKKNNLKFVVLKGMALNHLKIYKNSERQVRDIDILVKKEDLKKCYEELKSLGFEYYQRNTTDSCDFLYDFYHLPPLINSNNSVIEVHTRLTKSEIYKHCPLSEYVYSNCIKADNIFVPDYAALVAHAFYHGLLHHNLEEGPVFLLDIKNLLEKCNAMERKKLKELLIGLKIDDSFETFNAFISKYKKNSKADSASNVIRNLIKSSEKKNRYTARKFLLKLKKRFTWISYRYQIPIFSTKYVWLFFLENFKFLKDYFTTKKNVDY